MTGTEETTGAAAAEMEDYFIKNHLIQVEEIDTDCRNVLTAGQRGLALQKALGTEGRIEYLRERWRQLAGSRRQLQSPV